jgi:hypothetical protein
MKFKSVKKNTRWLIVAMVAIILVAMISACSDSENTSGSSSENTKSSSAEQTKATGGGNWKYSEDTDKMDNSKNNSASLTSDNSIKFEFPYGDSDFTLTIKKSKGKTEIRLAGSNCQFISGLSGETTYRVKFDDEAPFDVTADEPSEGSSNVVILGSSEKLISKLKTASKMIIEGKFFEAGEKQINFSTKGLKWE